MIKWCLSGAALGQCSKSHPLADALVTLPGPSRGRWPEEFPLSLAAGDDTSQCFQERLKIPALHKTRRAEDPREEEMGSFLSARAEQRRERSLVLAGCSRGGGICGDIAITHSIHSRLGKGGTVATGSGASREGLGLGLVTAAFQEQLPILLLKEWFRCLPSRGFSG